MVIVSSVLCPPWCNPAEHDDAGPRDQWCTSSAWEYETQSSIPEDRDTISISIQRYTERNGDGWVEGPAKVFVQTSRDGVDLLPHEALMVAQRIVAAHAVANGTAVTW